MAPLPRSAALLPPRAASHNSLVVSLYLFLSRTQEHTHTHMDQEGAQVLCRRLFSLANAQATYFLPALKAFSFINSKCNIYTQGTRPTHVLASHISGKLIPRTHVHLHLLESLAAADNSAGQPSTTRTDATSMQNSYMQILEIKIKPNKQDAYSVRGLVPKSKING